MQPCPTSFRWLKEGQPELENYPDSSYNQCLPQDRERILVWRARHYPLGLTISLSILLQKLRCQHVQMSVCCQPAVDIVRQYMKPLVRKHSIDGCQEYTHPASRRARACVSPAVNNKKQGSFEAESSV